MSRGVQTIWSHGVRYHTLYCSVVSFDKSTLKDKITCPPPIHNLGYSNVFLSAGGRERDCGLGKKVFPPLYSSSPYVTIPYTVDMDHTSAVSVMRGSRRGCRSGQSRGVYRGSGHRLTTVVVRHIPAITLVHRCELACYARWFNGDEH